MGRRRSQDVGTETETAVVKALRAHGFGAAERRRLRGVRDAGDIAGTPGLCWSVKGGDKARHASDGLVHRWWDELQGQLVHAGADVGVLVLQRHGIGLPNADQWWAVMSDHDSTGLILSGSGTRSGVPLPGGLVYRRLVDVCRLLRWAGYGDPLPGGEAEWGMSGRVSRVVQDAAQ